MAKSTSTTTQPIIRNRLKYIAAGLKGKGEENLLPSQTIPNQAMSIQEMVNKFTISSEWPKVFDQQFDTPQSMGLPDLTKMDKIEIQTLANKTKNDIEKQQAALIALQEEEYQKVQQENEQIKAALAAKKSQEIE